MDDDEPVCPIPAITEKVKHRCAGEWQRYEACAARIKGNAEADCESWYFDYYKCLDKWRGPEIFKKLK
eukprot:CAMPEP_0114477676 /NCGR_PEP_ID=MMETSP0104-20121206/15500_1 /TAXON_ID=37642 ORGANISM="Paraphysomonas imperforata, Strain PA2" /NCGR_SAMPLE_ID=MMETSP0104 /ASSEMBLY_ACC=CAM_ASM_000202 /LENGTH=67 /DNA_ID=CAMNT_0001652659 /DNA_START=42 /DNA_END=245 /DNA_ORIENTATION=+